MSDDDPQRAGRQVRIYFNDLLVGQTRASPAGRFLVQAERELPVGDYIVRADVLANDAATVIARVAVPFERRRGEKMAAVAPGAAGPEGDGPEAGGAAGDRIAPADDGEPDIGGAQARADGASTDGGTGGDAGEQDAQMAPRLEPVEGSVIIRRGDTLWQISRRVYGRGIRYTTIYLANQNQIEDPDLIWPGQVFNLPRETESGEEADLDALGDRFVPSFEREQTAR